MTPEPHSIRWGILGAGRIARSFAADLRASGHHLAAVGARDGEAACAFADEFQIPHAHQGYDALVTDDTVDIVYIATPQGLHEEHALLAFAAGRPALIEKSFTVDGPGARRVVEAARAAGVFAMEAMWTRFLPPMVELRRLVAAGDLGEPLSVSSRHFQAIKPEPGSRHLDPALGGGALVDLGVYGISFATALLGAASEVQALGTLLPSGVDASASVLLRHERGDSTTEFSMVASGPNRAVVVGTEGYVEFDPFWFAWAGFTRFDGGRPAVELGRFEGGPVPRRLDLQAAEAERCLREGLLESPVVPLDESVAVMETLDLVRDRLDLTAGVPRE